VGLVVPSVVYNGDGCVGIRRFLLEETRIERFYGFENRRKIFPIDSRYKFVSLVFRKEEPGDGFDGAFMRHDLAELEEEGPRPWTVRLSREEIARLSPLTLAFVEYRSKRDQAICTKMYAGCRTIGDVGPESWGAKLISDLSHVQIYNSARDKDLWTNPETKRAFSPETVIGRAEPTRGATIRGMLERGYLPVFEGKSVDQFVVGTRPVRWWLEASRAEKKYRRLPRTDKLLVFRMIARNTDERTCIAAVLPPGSAATDTLAGVLLTHVEPDAAASVLNSFCFDYALRLRSAGTKLSFTYVRPCPVPRPGVVNMLPRIATSISGGAYREHVTEAESVWPALWNSNRGVAEAYGLGPDDLEHILSSFTVLARKRPAYFAYLKERLSEWTAQAGRTRRGSAPERLAQVAEGLEDRGISEPANGGPSPGAEE
jgi:hypothetical protein